jgi:hypothetical protein
MAKISTSLLHRAGQSVNLAGTIVTFDDQCICELDDSLVEELLSDFSDLCVFEAISNKEVTLTQDQINEAENAKKQAEIDRLAQIKQIENAEKEQAVLIAKQKREADDAAKALYAAQEIELAEKIAAVEKAEAEAALLHPVVVEGDIVVDSTSDHSNQTSVVDETAQIYEALLTMTYDDLVALAKAQGVKKKDYSQYSEIETLASFLKGIVKL